MIKIRNYNEVDGEVLARIYFNTIRVINIRDYSQDQVEAWAPDDLDLPAWYLLMKRLSPFVAEIDGVVVGYTDLQPDGLIDHFFCHHKYQGQGVGKALMSHVFEISQQRGLKRLYSDVSITARPFYERCGFRVVRKQEVQVHGQKLTNFVMEKC